MLQHHRSKLHTFKLQRLCLAIRKNLQRRPAPAATPEQPLVDLVGADQEGALPQRPAITGDGAMQTDHPQTEAWSFQQPVLLRRSSRASSVIVWTAVGGTALLILWSLLAPLGESVAVQGKLQPGRRVKRVEAPVAGIVAELLVREGQTVRQGQLLLRFDLRQARSQLMAAEASRQRLMRENRIYAEVLGDQTAGALSPNQRLRLSNQLAQRRSSLQAATAELRQSEQRLAGLSQAWRTATDIADRYSRLVQAGAVSGVQELQTRSSANQLRSQMLEEQRTIARLKANLVQVQVGPAAELRGRIETNLRQITDLDGQIRQARLQIQYGQLRAPLNGVVFDLKVSPSSVVEAAAPMLVLVPSGSLEARVLVPSRVIGFISPGMKARLSLDTFPATDYGYLPALVRDIGSDALTAEEMRTTLGAEAAGLFYPVVLELSHQTLAAGQRQVPLKAGMTLTADIQLRQRPFISVLTSFFEDKLRSLERLR